MFIIHINRKLGVEGISVVKQIPISES